ncbi:MAG: hypothetical protein PWP62_471, partial [Eubacteriaceae bacterium]|nr:hypothetical protein [Eubacteriaceae bacterium]
VFEKIIDKLGGLIIEHFPGCLAVKQLVRLVAGMV